MKLTCPRCGHAIEGAAVNVAADLAQCPGCNQVFRASRLVPAESRPESLDPPVGSRIAFRRELDSEGVFEIPRRALSAGPLALIGFSLFWLGFVGFWTWGASHGGVLFAAFSIPFWLVGLGMLGGGMNTLVERQSVEIAADAFTIRKRRPLFARCTVVPYAEVSSVEVKLASPQNWGESARGMRTHGSDAPMGVLAVTVAYGTKTVRFAEGVSEAEMKWLADILRAVVYKKTGRRV